MIGKTNHN